jgi:hypothetical protein
VGRDFCRNALALQRVLPVRGGDKDQVHVNHVFLRLVAVAALVFPRSKLHQPRGETYNRSVANSGAFTRRVDAKQNTAVPRQVQSVPAFCLWCFLVKLLLKLLETDEGHKRREAQSHRSYS